MLSSFGTDPGATFLTPGQQYQSTEQPGLDAESLTVARLVRDRLGLMHVTMRTNTGREISAFVEQVELAVNLGQLVPVDPAGNTVLC